MKVKSPNSNEINNEINNIILWTCDPDEKTLPYILLHSYKHGFRGKGRPKKRRIDNIPEECMDIGIPIQEGSHIATTDSERWRNSVRKMGYQNEDIVFVVTAISQVSKSLSCKREPPPNETCGDLMPSLRCGQMSFVYT